MYLLSVCLQKYFTPGMLESVNKCAVLCNATEDFYRRIEELTANETIDDTLDIRLFQGGLFLGCEFHLVAMYVWVVGILASGESSMMTGTFAGQFNMESFLNIKWPCWKLVIFTLSIAIAPPS